MSGDSLRSDPGKHRLLHYHVDSGAEQFEPKLKRYLLWVFATTVT